MNGASVMAIVVAIILGVLALGFVLYPLYHREPDNEIPPASEQGSSVLVERGEKEQAARTALQEVELDYQLGNISDDDYQSLREQYMQRALQALKLRYEREQELDQEIEEQLKRLREQAHETTE
jgi:hypothetical protein